MEMAGNSAWRKWPALLSWLALLQPRHLNLNWYPKSAAPAV